MTDLIWLKSLDKIWRKIEQTPESFWLHVDSAVLGRRLWLTPFCLIPFIPLLSAPHPCVSCWWHQWHSCHNRGSSHFLQIYVLLCQAYVMLLLVPPFNSDIIMDIVCPKAVLQNLPCQLLEFLSCHIGSNKEALVTVLSPSGVLQKLLHLLNQHGVQCCGRPC